MTYKIVCAWCGKTIGEKEGSGNCDVNFSITHSICKECHAKVMAELEQDKEVENVR